MNERTGHALFAAGMLAIFTVYALVSAQGEKVLHVDASGFMPETITIAAVVKPDTRICAVPVDGGMVSCRTVAEFRTWVAQRPAR